MAKSDTPLAELDLDRAYSPPHTPKWADDMPIHGYDTETADGDVFMLSVAFEGFGGYVEENGGDFLTPKQLWDYITHERARGALNMWYNLDFDANVLLKHMLDETEMAILTTSGSVMTRGYEITYIPSKFLKVKGPNNHVYTHYDASQFFYTSLENAAQEWLDTSKLSDDINVAKFGKGANGVNQYISDNYRHIKKYARKDAELVRDLWQEAVAVGERDLDIPMGRPFSTGYLAESYLNAHLHEKPGLGPRDVSKMAWETYAGGRFEVLKRGDIGPVAGPDINSAYPWVLSSLPDPKTLVWSHYDNPDIQELADADYGFVRATVTTDKDRPIQPFARKVDDKLKYPALVNTEVCTLKDTFVFAYNHGYLESLDIQEAWLGYDNGAYYPFDFIQGLYDQRKGFEAAGDMKKGLLLKIILNSMYGKMCQTTPKREKVDGTVNLDDGEKYVADMSLPPAIREAYQDGFKEWLEAGAWFNPFLATYITGLTRLELHKQVVKYGLEDNTVMLATDSLMVEQEPFEQSDFADDLVKDGLGNWDYDYTGEAFVVGAGVYQVDYDTCKDRSCPDYGQPTNPFCEALGHTRKVKTRGFNESDIWGGLRYQAQAANGHITIESIRPKTVAEIIWSRDEVSNIGKFLKAERDLQADMDEKRRWGQPASFERLTQGTQDSKPLVLSE